MRTLLALTIILFCLLSPLGCKSVTNMITPPSKQGESAIDDFIYAMRWQQFNAAAGFMKPELRKDFLATFKNNKDLTITDIRLMETTLSEEGRRAEVLIEIDYYLLPSATLKTFPLEQTWVYFDGESQSTAYYQIVTPFPPFP